MKKTADTLAAEKALEAKKQEITAAEAALKVLRSQLDDAHKAVSAARLAGDDCLPKATIVSIGWRSSTVIPVGVGVIDRVTPGGMLIVRRIGTDIEYRFTWNGRVFRVKPPRGSWTYDSVELRDVPPEFIPIDAAMNARKEG